MNPHMYDVLILLVVIGTLIALLIVEIIKAKRLI